MTEHHRFGPSQLEHYDPRTRAGKRGCYAFVPGEALSTQDAEAGSLKHQAAAARDLSLLEGDLAAIEEVKGALEFIDAHVYQGPYAYQAHELTLKDDLFFGTLDVLSRFWKRAVVIDLKFGAWPVTNAKYNLQGWGYVALVFHNFPELKSVRMIFYMARSKTWTEHVFFRSNLPELVTRLERVVRNATRAAGDPALEDFTPSPVNCGFCSRLNCPARLALCSTLVTQWTGKPVSLPHLELVTLSLHELSVLKRLSNVFKTFAGAIDNEARRRAFDCNEIVEGYEIKQKSGPRKVLGAANIQQAAETLEAQWKLFFPGRDPIWVANCISLVEIAVSDLEKLIYKESPNGQKVALKNLLLEALEKAGLISSTPVFYLSAIKE